MQSAADWGPSLWKSIHFIALGYPDNPSQSDRYDYKNFYTSLGKVLPCMRCSRHYEQHLESLPIHDYLDTQDRLFEWTVRLHNAVNRDLGKPTYSVEAPSRKIKKKLVSFRV